MLCSRQGEAEMAWPGLSYPILQRGFALGTGQDSTPDLPAQRLLLELCLTLLHTLEIKIKTLKRKGNLLFY